MFVVLLLISKRFFKKNLLINLLFLCLFFGHGSGKSIKIFLKEKFFMYLKNSWKLKFVRIKFFKPKNSIFFFRKSAPFKYGSQPIKISLFLFFAPLRIFSPEPKPISKFKVKWSKQSLLKVLIFSWWKKFFCPFQKPGCLWGHDEVGQIKKYY